MNGVHSKPKERRILWLVFSLCVLLAAFRLYRLRYFDIDNDEAESISIGWLIANGKLIYKDIFTHHQPINYMLTHLIAILSPHNSFANMRILPFVYYVLCAFSFIWSSVKIKLNRRILAATIFLIFTTILCPIWYGWLVLVDNMWAAFFVCFFNILIMPLLFTDLSDKAGSRLFFISGLLLALWVSGSLITVYPFAIVACALMPLLKSNNANTKKSLIALLVGFTLPIIIQLMWLYKFGDIKDYYEQGILFNLNIYSEFSNFTGRNFAERVLSLTSSIGLRSFLHLDKNINIIKMGLLIFEVIALLIYSNYLKKKRNLSRGYTLSGAIFLYLLFQSLAVRNFPFHSAPYCLTLMAFFSWSFILLFESFKKDKWATGVLFACIALSVWLAKEHAIPTTLGEKSTWSTNNLNMTEGMGHLYPTIEYIKKNTSENDTIAALPDFPIIYYETNRRPALGAVYYWPWQREWEKSKGRMDACGEIKSNKPKFIWAEDVIVWNKYPFHDYAECIWSYISTNYNPVGPMYPNLYVGKVYQ